MEGDEQVAAAQPAAQSLLQLFAAQQGQAADVVQAGGADVEDARGLLAQLNDPAPIDFGCGKMQLAHLGDAVADGVVVSSHGELSSGDVSCRHAGYQCSLHGSKSFGAVAQHNHNVGLQFIQCFGKRNQGQGIGFADAHRRIGREQHLDFFGNGKAVVADLGPGVAKLGRKVHAGHQQLQFHFGILVNGPDQRAEQAVFGPGSCDYANFPHGFLFRVLSVRLVRNREQPAAPAPRPSAWD